MMLESKYDRGDMVFIKTDPDQVQRMITAIMWAGTGIQYQIKAGVNDSWHFEYEITQNANFSIKFT